MPDRNLIQFVQVTVLYDAVGVCEDSHISCNFKVRRQPHYKHDKLYTAKLGSPQSSHPPTANRNATCDLTKHCISATTELLWSPIFFVCKCTPGPKYRALYREGWVWGFWIQFSNGSRILDSIFKITRFWIQISDWSGFWIQIFLYSWDSNFKPLF